MKRRWDALTGSPKTKLPEAPHVGDADKTDPLAKTSPPPSNPPENGDGNGNGNGNPSPPPPCTLPNCLPPPPSGPGLPSPSKHPGN